jgi:DNA-binding NarL/FixJ family response regulator
MATRTTVFLIQDKALMRAGLASLIKKRDELDLVGEAGSREQALHLVQASKPDVIVMDLRSITAEELDAPKAVRTASAKSRILLLMDDSDEGEVFATLATEADGYCLREAEFDKIFSAIQTVAAGEFWLDSGIARKVVKALLDTMAILATDPQDFKNDTVESDELSPRELEVLSLVSKGLSNLKIADKLGISAETVKTHIRHIMKKLVVSDRTQAAVKALKRGLI